MSDEMALTPRPDPTTGRDTRGLFAPGNTYAKGHAGGPKRAAELRRIFRDCMLEQDVKDLFASLLKQALGGDVAAARVLLDRAMDRPMQAVEISGPEGRALDLTTIVGVIMTALGDDPAARVRVAAAFKRMGRLEAADGLG